jgi:hypothetical protein
VAVEYDAATGSPPPAEWSAPETKIAPAAAALASSLAKQTAAVEWCKYATEHAQQHGGKEWQYLLIPHDAIAGNMTLKGLASRFAII